MTELVSMKIDEAACLAEAYPYGLRICLNNDQCEALGVKGPISAGTKLGITALVVVAQCTESTEMDGDDTGNGVRLELQITDMALTAPPSQVNATALYSNSTMEA
jgi:hypothetical protein